LLRYLYGLPLCEENESMDAVTLVGMCDAALWFGMPDLCDHGLRKLKELLAELLIPAVATGRWPNCCNGELEPFMKELQDLFKPETANLSDDSCNPMVQMVARVCCTNFAILECDEDFTEFMQDQPQLSWAMLRYAALCKENILH
jgi:hypothetical protein